MKDFMRLFLASAQDVAVKQGQSTVERIEQFVLFSIAAGICAVAAVSLVVAAAWIYAIPLVGPAGAPLLVACLLAVLCGVLLMARRPATKALVVTPPGKPTQTAPEVLLAEAVHLLKEHKGLTLLTALLAGLELSRRDH